MLLFNPRGVLWIIADLVLCDYSRRLVHLIVILDYENSFLISKSLILNS